jgi:hypothetical protein
VKSNPLIYSATTKNNQMGCIEYAKLAARHMSRRHIAKIQKNTWKTVLNVKRNT